MGRGVVTIPKWVRQLRSSSNNLLPSADSINPRKSLGSPPRNLGGVLQITGRDTRTTGAIPEESQKTEYLS